MKPILIVILSACLGDRTPAPAPADAPLVPDASVCEPLACDWRYCEAIDACVCLEVVGADFVCPTV